MSNNIDILLDPSSNKTKRKEQKRVIIEACLRAFICILLIVLSIYFTPNFVAKNISTDGILEQITELRIYYMRLAFGIISTIGLLIGALYIRKPDLLNTLQEKIFHKSNATQFLVLLLFADFAFVVIHFVSFYTPYLNFEINSLYYDWTLPEIYQYFKWLWIIILLIYVSRKRRSFGYMAWALVFTYFLLDDALQIHERFGAYVTRNFDFIPPFGLRVADIGEMAISAIVGMSLFFLIAWAYVKGKQAFKKVSQEMLLLIFALVFFGVGADMVLLAINLGGLKGHILGVIEDAGEMWVASLILWYVFVLSTRDKNTRSYICYILRIFPAAK